MWDNVGAPHCFTMRICSVMNSKGRGYCFHHLWNMVCKHYGGKELIFLDHGVLLQCPLIFLEVGLHFGVV